MRSRVIFMKQTHGKGHAQGLLKEELFRVLVDHSPRPLLITDDHVDIEYVNPAWEKQFGYKLREVRGKNPKILQSGKTPREVYVKMRKALHAGKVFRSDQVVDRRKNGTFFNLKTTIFPVRSGGKLHYVQVLDDITQGKRVEKLRKLFLRTAAHDIRSPLQILRLMSETIYKSAHRRETIHDMQEEISRVDHLTRTLLNTSLFESGKMRLNVGNVDLNALVTQAIHAAASKGRTITFHNSGKVIVRGDPDRISEVLTNLIENAIKYSRKNTPIAVSVVQKGERIITSVRDRGIGIAAGQQKKIFAANYRTKPGGDVPGTGLGLYIAKKIVKAHRGNISVDSKVGKGSTFSFSLPVGRGINVK